MSRFRRMPSPAMVVAFLALAVALGGTAWAAVISGSTIKKNSIPGNRLKKKNVGGDRLKSNTLSGSQIRESKLGKVPKAKRADSASNALALGSAKPGNYQTFAAKAIPRGTTVTGVFGFRSAGTENRAAYSLPGLAPADLGATQVNFRAATGVGDADATCTGSAASPTAPAGKVCLYLAQRFGNGSVTGEAAPGGARRGFVVRATSSMGEPGAFGTWAYTAP